MFHPFSSGDGPVVTIATNDDPATQKTLLQNSTQINIVPVSPLEYSGNGAQPSTSDTVTTAPVQGKGTTVVITTQKGPLPTQVVLNFPMDAGLSYSLCSLEFPRCYLGV